MKLDLKLGAYGLVAVVALVLASTAAAALPYWWFTPTKANRAVVAKNFQLWYSDRWPDAHTKIAKSACKGYGLAKRQNGLRYYRHFVCKATWSYDANPPPQYGPGPFTSPLLCDTTKTKPLGLKCQKSA